MRNQFILKLSKNSQKPIKSSIIIKKRHVQYLEMTELEGQIKDLSNLIYSWNLVNVDSKSEFDEFSKKLLNALNREETEEKIRRIIETELCFTFGLFFNEFDSLALTNEFVQWQNK